MGHESQTQIVLTMILYIGKSQPQCSYKIVFIRKSLFESIEKRQKSTPSLDKLQVIVNVTF